MNQREAFNDHIKELKEQMKECPVEILTGPCKGIVVKDSKSLLEYSKRLDSWMFPQEPMRVRPLIPLY
jgi:hypothetical protein